MPDEPEVLGLLALMRFNRARADARFDSSGELVLLRDQDRSKWDRALIAETFQLIGRFMRMRGPGPYQLQALIAGAHADAKSWETTRWNEIVRSYDALLEFSVRRSSVSIARSRYGTSKAGARLAQVDALAGSLRRYHLFHATRAELLRALGRTADAREADERALELTENPAESALLTKRLATRR